MLKTLAVTMPNLKPLYKRLIMLAANLALALWCSLTLQLGIAHAQTGTGDFAQATEAITKGIQTFSVTAVALLIVAGFALLMWSGVSDTIRIKSVRILFFAVVGSAGLFLFAEPLSSFITTTFNAGGPA